MSEVSESTFVSARASECVAPVDSDNNCRSSSSNKPTNRIHDDGVHMDGREHVVGSPLSKGSNLETLPTLQTVAGQKAGRIGIRSRGKILLLDPHEVISVEAQGNYVLLRRRTDSHMLRESISVVAEKLKPYGLVQIHRSVLVNKWHIVEIRSLPTGEYRLRLKGEREYTVTRTYKRTLRDFADTWIGLDAFAHGMSVSQKAGVSRA